MHCETDINRFRGWVGCLGQVRYACRVGYSKVEMGRSKRLRVDIRWLEDKGGLRCGWHDKNSMGS